MADNDCSNKVDQEKLSNDCCNEVACNLISTILENEKIKECVWNMIEDDEDIEGDNKSRICFNYIWAMIGGDW